MMIRRAQWFLMSLPILNAFSRKNGSIQDAFGERVRE